MTDRFAPLPADVRRLLRRSDPPRWVEHGGGDGDGDGAAAGGPGVHWVRPELVAEIAFTEWTGDGKLRHPRFVGLRHDKPPRQVVRERADRTGGRHG